ncbi:CFEM domain-containing protein [Aspergillus foveolatus]|uniref:CFEM domain-containing protein n=1 Tax=Aspergillus foveolatus TaxID=210207 RepID=UPI003CCCE3CD
MDIRDQLPPVNPIPDCARSCLTAAAAEASCSLTEAICVCYDQTVVKAMGTCVVQACSVSDIFAVRRFSDTICGAKPRAQTQALVVVSTTFLVIMIVCVLMRTVARVLNRNYGLDDLATSLSVGIAIAIAAIVYPTSNLGLGTDIWYLERPKIDRLLHLFVVTTNLYIPCLAVIKISMSLLYLRIFPNRSLRIATFAMLAIVSMWGVAYTLVIIWICRPRSFAWLGWDSEHTGTCVNSMAVQVSHAILNIVFDVIVLGMPLPVLLRLDMSKTKKAGVLTALNIVRVVTTYNFLKSRNQTRDFIPFCIWNIVEIDLGIICSCLPGMRALLKIIIPGCGSTNEAYDYDYSSPQEAPGNSRNRHKKSFHLSVDGSGLVRSSTRRERNAFVALPDLPPTRSRLISQLPENRMAEGSRNS